MKIKGGPYDDKMWVKTHVKWDFVGRLCASVPSNEEIIQGWLDARKPAVRPPGGKSITETVEEVINRLPDQENENEEIKKKTTLVFEKVEGRLVIRANTIRAHIKDCVSQVQNQFAGKIRGERYFTTRVKNGLYVKGNFRDSFGTELVALSRDGKPINEPDGFIEKPVHVNGPQGPQNALKRFAYVIRPTVEFTVRLLGKSVSVQDLATVMMYGATHAYGGERSMQDGQYQYEIETKEKELA